MRPSEVVFFALVALACARPALSAGNCSAIVTPEDCADCESNLVDCTYSLELNNGGIETKCTCKLNKNGRAVIGVCVPIIALCCIGCCCFFCRGCPWYEQRQRALRSREAAMYGTLSADDSAHYVAPPVAVAQPYGGPPSYTPAANYAPTQQVYGTASRTYVPLPFSTQPQPGAQEQWDAPPQFQSGVAPMTSNPQ